ncbi:hypothetical protein GGR56DRAFT_679189 [Xylariaceae sp. FL0804]|nr:hypothetical protein GGR56DRAFT_679189 [Xylariaceae sp. FL0804]
MRSISNTAWTVTALLSLDVYSITLSSLSPTLLLTAHSNTRTNRQSLSPALKGSKAADTTVSKDPLMGLTFTQCDALYSTGTNSILYRLAVPQFAGSDYDLGVQADKSTSVVSARRTNSYTIPQPDPQIALTLLKKGTAANATHWQYTALCCGCSSFPLSGGYGETGPTTLSGNGTTSLRWALSSTPPTGDLASPNATLHVHDAFGTEATTSRARGINDDNSDQADSRRMAHRTVSVGAL